MDGGYTEYTRTVGVLSPAEGIELLIEQVNDLVEDGALSPDAAEHMLHELEQALKHLDDGTIPLARHFPACRLHHSLAAGFRESGFRPRNPWGGVRPGRFSARRRA
jgi:hypothetical protein